MWRAACRWLTFQCASIANDEHVENVLYVKASRPNFLLYLNCTRIVMRRFEFAADGPAYRLDCVERPIPEPASGNVVVRVRAASLNYRDLVHLRNKAGRDVAGRVPLSDGAGEVVAVGADVTDVKVGDRVLGCFFQTWNNGSFEMAHHQAALGGTADGMLAEYVELRAAGTVPMPEPLTFEEAACLPCAGLTAWTALVSRGHLRPGQSVLVLGTGGVSTFATQFAAAMGCSVIATSSSDEKLARAKQLGATHLINYRTTPDWDKAIWQLTGKQGVDQVIEVGGPGTLEKSIASVRAGGHIALIGVLTGFGSYNGSLFPLVAKNATLSGMYVGSREDFLAMNDFVSKHSLKPIIDRVFTFDEAAAAFDYLERGEHVGKVVISIAK